jgi:hypothetical protein
MKILLFVATLTFFTGCLCLQAQQNDDGGMAHFTTIRQGQGDYSVAKFTLSQPWIIPQKVAALDDSMETWKLLVLIGKSDASQLLTSNKFRDVHESKNQISDDLIDAQKDRMRQLYRSPSDPVKVEDLYLVIDKKTAKANIVIAFVSDRGVSYSAFTRINGDWKIVIADVPDPVLSVFPNILSTYNEMNKNESKKFSDKELEEITKSHVDMQQMPK